MLDIVDRGRHGPFADRYDAFLHIVRRQARIGPNDADYRDIDVRKNVFRRDDGCNAAQNQHEY